MDNIGQIGFILTEQKKDLLVQQVEIEGKSSLAAVMHRSICSAAQKHEISARNNKTAPSESLKEVQHG